ncbi:MAG: DUF6774 domain-containing protein [Oscillospiraceae bacterium]
MICPSELAALINAASIAIAKGKTVEELNILSSIFVQIGDTLATISIQTSHIQLCCDKMNNSNNSPDKSEFIV